MYILNILNSVNALLVKNPQTDVWRVLTHEIHDHRDGRDATKRIRIYADGSPGPDCAYSTYRADVVGGCLSALVARFQRGRKGEPGFNTGITDAVLLAIVLDRLRSLQSGPTKCHENAVAIGKISETIDWLKHRDTRRNSREASDGSAT